MSNPLKGIGKVFKKVVKVVKKVALPALAIGAVVLTGGAALGVIPALAGAGGLGLSTGLATVVASAGWGGIAGAATAAISGKNILKGMTRGAVIGAATGGLASLAKVPVNLPGMFGKGATLPIAPDTWTEIGAGTLKEAGAAAGTLPAAANTAARVSTGLGSAIGRAAPTVINTVVDKVGDYALIKAKSKEEQKEAARKAANYGTGGFFQAGGGGFSSVMAPFASPPRPSYAPSLVPPAQRWPSLAASSPRPAGKWKIDPISGEPYQENV